MDRFHKNKRKQKDPQAGLTIPGGGGEEGEE